MSLVKRLSSSDLNLEQHMIFLCPECGQENASQPEWRRHLNAAHHYAKKTFQDFNFEEVDDNHHECQICLKWIANARQTPAVLQYHRFNHLPYPKIYRCRHCRGVFLRKRSLIDHLYAVHSRLLNKQLHQNRQDAVNQLRGHRDPKQNKEFYIRYLCPLCGKLFERFTLWEHHIDSAHSSTSVDLKMHRIAGTKNYYCSECSHTLRDGPTRSQLQRHHFSHMAFPAFFQCAFCYSRKAYKTELLLHFIKYHTADFLLHRHYIFFPDEWGGCADTNVVREVRHLMEIANKKSKPDILQKALDDINLEDGEDLANETGKFNHEEALDQSLNGYDNVFVVEMGKATPVKKPSIKFSEISENELESIYQEMFEEIVTISTNEDVQTNMQKYIHYLCPECGNEFEDQPTWRSHVYDAHNLINAVDAKFRPLNASKTLHLCLVCHQIQKTSKHADLRRHHFQHMPFQSYLKCIICGKTKSSKPKMMQHMEYVHILVIRKEIKLPYLTNIGQPKVVGKKYHCLECDKLYAVHSRFKNHCRSCPKRLAPLPVAKCDISKNQKLLEHLKAASVRLDKMMQEIGIESKS
ncbi:uncharacterized protein LOC106090485 [Stomoxys calcitrans]|uniref:uncharacterized protein LOC106090485 n=1 Tax=Stomoxys calcitrans TaxID=35570 RepID=UPI0027E28050|nr:uncharacterized protein LOC106090485 [Stomoxys calcitrans]